jgi:hypothetical protein
MNLELKRAYSWWVQDEIQPLRPLKTMSQESRDKYPMKNRMADVALLSKEQFNEIWMIKDYDACLKTLRKYIIDSNATFEELMEFKYSATKYDEDRIYVAFIDYTELVFSYATERKITTVQRDELFNRYVQVLSTLPVIKKLGSQEKEDGIWWFGEVERLESFFDDVEEKAKTRFLDAFFAAWNRMSGPIASTQNKKQRV